MPGRKPCDVRWRDRHSLMPVSVYESFVGLRTIRRIRGKTDGANGRKEPLTQNWSGSPNL